MRLPRGVRRLFRLGTFRRDVERDLDDELGFHRQKLVEQLLRDGMTEQHAKALARERFGDERAYREALRRIDTGRVRMRERSEFVDVVVGLWSQAVRSLYRSPGLTLAIVVILALGIGANAVMFGVVDRLLLSPPQHVDDWEQLRHLYLKRTIFNGDVSTGRTLTYPDYDDLTRVSGWSSVAAYTTSQALTVGRGEGAQRERTVKASASLFPLLGVQPVIGRTFSVEEDLAGAPPTAVLAHEFWERRYGADESVLGSSLDIGRGTYTVIGIMPPGFTGAELEPVDIWLPLETAQAIEEQNVDWHDTRNWWWLRTVARLSAEATDEATTAQATALHRRGQAEQIEADRYDSAAEIMSAPIIAARGPTPTAEADVARWLAGVSAIVLLIACLNVANLLLARGIRTRRETAVRLALGVSRRRLVAQLLTESLVFSALGAGAALLVARLGGGVLHQLLLPNVAFADQMLNPRLVFFTGIAALLSTLLAGVIPGLQVSRPDVADALRDGGRGVSGGGSRTRASLLVGQAALSVVLLVGAGLFVQSFRNAQGMDLGYEASRVAVIALEWNETLSAADREAVYQQLLPEIRRSPAVLEAAFTYTVPFQSSISLGQPRIPGRDSIPRHHGGGPYVNKVSSGYFEAMRLSIVRGRSFEALDDAPQAPPVTVLSESMATAIWPDEDPIGQCMVFGDSSDAATACTTVVGVVENHRRQALVEDDEFMYYVTQRHPALERPPQGIVAGTIDPASDAAESLRVQAASVSPLVRFATVLPLQSSIDPALRPWRMGAYMFTLFGLLALVVAAWGLYSVLAFDIALRRQELGVRSALGAGVGRLVGLVFKRAAGLVIMGVALGVVASLAAARFVSPLLFQVSPSNPTVYAGVTITLLLVAALAGTLPALRASRVDPSEALRAD